MPRVVYPSAVPATPPPPPPPLTEPSLPIGDLRQFIEEVGGLFDNIAHYWNQVLFEHSFRDRIRNAWGEVKSSLAAPLESLLHSNDAEAQQGLRDAGLVGEQLKLKLAVLNDVWSKFSNQGSVGLLQELLEVAGSLIESLAKAFPQIEALKEIIAMVKWLIDQAARWTPSKTVTPPASAV